MQQKPSPNKNGIVLLELLFHDQKNSRLSISMDQEKFKSMILFDFAHIDYISDSKTYTIENDEIKKIIKILITKLLECLSGKQLLHESIKKPLGYLLSKYYKNDQRKDLVYAISSDGYRYWVGGKYGLFSSAGQLIPSSWLYNDKDKNIVLEISPIYPWIYSNPKSDKNFIKFSEWMNQYKPFVITKIEPETAKMWIKQLDLLMQKVRRSDKKFRCTGPGCKHCTKEGKTGCPCGSKL